MRNLVITLVAAGITAIITVACSGSGSADLCKDRNIRCEEPLSCDPNDGICKCGGTGGVVCAEGFACDANANTCLSTRCAGVNCSKFPGTSCDVFDGKCKCGGTGGTECTADQTCDPATKTCKAKGDCSTVACPGIQTCDPQTVMCTCGGLTCAEGQTCTVSSSNTYECVPDLCSGVKCLGDTACDPADGVCKCNGVACSAGSVCGCPPGTDAGTCAASAKTCQPGSACANVTCTGGTTCDPIDGKCKCGGPGGPVCGTDQVCSLGALQCQGGNQCALTDGGTKSCGGGTSCDPEDGLCKCGGRGGDVCGSGTDGGVEETCVQSLFAQTCRPKCDPRLQDCPSGTYCYFDTTAKTPTAYCATPTGQQTEGLGCNAATACFTTNPTNKGLFCNGLGTFEMPGSTGFCRSFCDTTVGMFSCSQAQTPQNCEPIAGAPAGVGYCKPVGQ